MCLLKLYAHRMLIACSWRFLRLFMRTIAFAAETWVHAGSLQAAICAAVVLFFSVAFLASWKAAQGLQQRAISAKTSAYSDTVHAAQADTCSVSHSFSWSINSHEVKSNPHYCVLLAKQVEARSSNIHLRRVYCTKCPSTCHAYKDICADKSKCRTWSYGGTSRRTAQDTVVLYAAMQEQPCCSAHQPSVA